MATRDVTKLKFETPEELQERIDDYFESLRVFVDEIVTDKDGNTTQRKVELASEPPTMAGLAEHLGVVRKTIYNYDQRDAFTPVIARAKNRLAAYAERHLFVGKNTNGAQFALSVNYQYGKEADAEEGTGEGLTVNVIPPADAKLLGAVPKWNPEDAPDE